MFENVTLIGHSWGGTLVTHWGSNNTSAMRGLVSIEVVYVPFPSWERVPKKIRGGVKLMLRRPFMFCGCFPFDLGAFLILKKNLMLESMPNRVSRSDFIKSGPEMEQYRKGFEDGPESRRPILAFLRSIPVAGEPKDVVDIMETGPNWIVQGEGRDIPKLFVSVEPGTMTPEDRAFIRSWDQVTEVKMKGGHMVTEDCPDAVGEAIGKWFRERVGQ